MMSTPAGRPRSSLRIVKVHDLLNLDSSVVAGAFNHHFLDARQPGEVFHLAEKRINVTEISVELQTDRQFVKLLVPAGRSLPVDRQPAQVVASGQSGHF